MPQILEYIIDFNCFSELGQCGKTRAGSEILVKSLFSFLQSPFAQIKVTYAKHPVGHWTALILIFHNCFLLCVQNRPNVLEIGNIANEA